MVTEREIVCCHFYNSIFNMILDAFFNKQERLIDNQSEFIFLLSVEFKFQLRFTLPVAPENFKISAPGYEMY
jgi:hypothetical protein